MNITTKLVKNFDVGRFGYKAEAIVIHISDGYLEGGYSWFNNPSSQVSAHFMVGRNGQIWKFVDVENTAWHAGSVKNPSWSLLKNGVNPNFYTIGIEHEGFTGNTWTDAMYAASAELIATLCRDFKIPLDRQHVIGHYQINSVSRPNCPGNGVDFNKLLNLASNYLEDPIMIKELQEQVAKLQSQLNSVNQDLEQYKSTVRLLAAERDSLKTINGKLSIEITKLQKSQTTLNKRVIELEKKLKQANIPLPITATSTARESGFLSSIYDRIFGNNG